MSNDAIPPPHEHRRSAVTLVEMEAANDLSNSEVLTLPQERINAVFLFHMREIRKTLAKLVSWQSRVATFLAIAGVFGKPIGEYLIAHPSALWGAGGAIGSSLVAYAAYRKRADLKEGGSP